MHWYPEICARAGGVWYLPDHRRPDSSIGEFADYNVDLRIDSSWSAAFPGELINDKQHFGLVPPPEDTAVQQDILANYSQIPNGERYTPVFEKGLKEYYIKSRSETGFPIVLYRNLVYDRAVADSVSIEVAYSHRQQKRWAGTIASEAAAFVRACSGRLGRPEPNRIAIAPGHIEYAAAGDFSLSCCRINPKTVHS